MICFDSIPSIYIAQGVTDLRKGMDQLAALVQNRYCRSELYLSQRASNYLKWNFLDSPPVLLIYSPGSPCKLGRLYRYLLTYLLK